MERRFKSEWEAYDLLPLGGFWAFCIGLIVDSMGIKKVRIAKGKIKGKVWRDEKGKIRYEVSNPSDPITLVNRINIKSKNEWERVKRLVDRWIEKLE